MIEKITLTEKEKQGLFNLGKEPPTTKTVEEVVEIYWKRIPFTLSKIMEHAEGQTIKKYLDTELRTTLTAQNQAADERLREVFTDFKEIIDVRPVTPEGAISKGHLVAEFKTIAARHGITNL